MIFKYPRKVAAFAVAAMILAACGGGDDGEDAAPPSDAAADADDADDEESEDVEPDTDDGEDVDAGEDAEAGEEMPDFGGPVRVMISTRFNLPMIGSDAAEELGIFDAMGLEVENLEGQDVPQGLASGDIDIGLASPNRFIGAILAGLEATIVGPTVDIWDQYIIVSTELGVDSIDDLEPGVSIGISRFGSAGHYSGEALAQQLGWSEGDFEIVTMGNLDGLLAGLRQGTIDMFMWSAQAAFTLEQEGAASILGNVGEFIGPNPLDVIIASNAAIAERPHAIRAFCEGYYEAQAIFQDDVELAIDTFVNVWGYEPDITPAIVASGSQFLSRGPEITDEMLANMAEATMFTIDDVGEITAADVAAMYTPCDQL